MIEKYEISKRGDQLLIYVLSHRGLQKGRAYAVPRLIAKIHKSTKIVALNEHTAGIQALSQHSSRENSHY